MGLQWTFIAAFLYTEIAIIFLLLLPFVSSQRWRRIFRSRILSLITSYSHIYFNVFVVMLTLAFLESIRQMNKYNASVDSADKRTVLTEGITHIQHMHLFRSQRNFYISGFTIFLLLVLKRIVSLISAQAHLQAESEAARRQAQSAADAASKFLAEKENLDDNTANKTREEAAAESEELKGAKQSLAETQELLDKARIDLEAMRSQAEATGREYDRLLKEFTELQQQQGAAGNKKDD